MSLIKHKNYRPFYVIARNYCEKTIYQIHEEGAKAKIIHGKPYEHWRKQWIERDGEWKSKLNIFVEKNPNPDIMNALSKLPNLNMNMIRDWWADLKIRQEIENQRFLPKRVSTLGANLAAVHFFTHREATVRLKGSPTWISGDFTTLKLPDHYEDGWIVEAVDCTKFHHNGIRYEGLENLSNLTSLKWLCVKNSKHIDAWCLDRIAGQNGQSLEYLDISGCKLCTGGVMAIRKMEALKFLVITEPGDDLAVQATLSMLEQEKPNLIIKTID